MQNKFSSQKNDPIVLGVIIFITLIGLAIRMGPALQTNFPLNDGSLFYAMIIDLQEAGYALPSTTTYNFAEIPFAYPPMAFYITGLLGDIFQVSILTLVRILPSIISAMCIPVFYFLAKELTRSKIQIVFGTLIFALLPRVFAWHIMGGGITRSFGMLFAMLTMMYAYRFYIRHEKRHLPVLILVGSLTFATHSEATVHTVITVLVFYLWKDRSIKGLLYSLIIAGGILLLTSPWWGLVLSRYGIDPFIASINAARQDSVNPLVGLIIFFRFLFADEPFLSILSTLGLLGLFASLARKRTLLPVWMFTLHLVEPRGGSLYMMIPLALMAGYAMETVVLPAIRTENEKNILPGSLEKELEHILGGKVTRYFVMFIFVMFIFAYSLMSAFSIGQKIKTEFSLTTSDLDAFTWVRENTATGSQFALVTGQLPLRDAWSEWFPVLAGRPSQASVFGYEWVNDGLFDVRVEAYKKLQACKDQDVSCIEEWTQSNNVQISYLYVRGKVGEEKVPLSIFLEQSSNYDLVFKNKETSIFRVR